MTIGGGSWGIVILVLAIAAAGAPGQTNAWSLNPGICASGGNCLQFPSDIDCDCDNGAGHPNATCTVTYDDITVHSPGAPQPLGSGSIICDNCGVCDSDCGTTKTCGTDFSRTITTNITVTLGSSVQGSVGVPGVAAVQGAINSSIGATAGGSMTVGGHCSISVQPCEHSDVVDIHATVRTGAQREVRHTWAFHTWWGTGNGCFGSDGNCPIDGQAWTDSCEDPMHTYAVGQVLETQINCGRTASHDCPGGGPQ